MQFNTFDFIIIKKIDFSNLNINGFGSLLGYWLMMFPFICLAQIENNIKENIKAEMAQLQQSAVHNHTAAMLEMGTNLLSQTAEQTRKLTDVETQVCPSIPFHATLT